MLTFPELCFLNTWMWIIILKFNFLLTVFQDLLQMLSECQVLCWALYILKQQVCVIVPILFNEEAEVLEGYVLAN